MDTACLEYCLTEGERRAFDERGYFVVEDALPTPMVEELTTAVDGIDRMYRPLLGLGPSDRLNMIDFVGKARVFLELLDCPRTFPKVWGLLGWNIQLYHSHLAISPPLPRGEEPVKKRLQWHQDSGRLNADIEGDPRPRISLKVAYFLTDTTEAGRGNFYVVPGSHLRNKLELLEDGVSDPKEATPVLVRAGSAVFFDRRLWHSPSPNTSEVYRKALFYGYSYRWLRPRDNVSVAHFIDRCDPIRRQLLGASAGGGYGYTSPKDEDVPLRVWLREHLGAEAVAP